jgi:hypothetical protein
MSDPYQEATLIIELARWGTEMGLDDALSEVFNENFDPESANLDDANVRTIITFFEIVGSLVKRGALAGDFVNDVWWVAGIWPRVQRHAMAAREGSGEPRLYENMEMLASM